MLWFLFFLKDIVYRFRTNKAHLMGISSFTIESEKSLVIISLLSLYLKKLMIISSANYGKNSDDGEIHLKIFLKGSENDGKRCIM